MIHVEQAIADARQALDEGRLDDAEAELRAVLEFDDFEPRALRMMGKVASKQGEPRRAADYYKQALQARDPEQRARARGPVPTPTLAALYADQGHTEAAVQVYRDLLSAHPNDERAGEWRRRLTELGGQAAPETAPAEPAGPAEVSAAGGGEGVIPGEVAEQRLRSFLERLDGNPEVARLRRFLERLDERAAN
jgi:tetratricopeptide (TPR) repeat protein